MSSLLFVHFSFFLPAAAWIWLLASPKPIWIDLLQKQFYVIMGVIFVLAKSLELHGYVWISDHKKHQKYIKSKTLYHTTETILQDV